MALHKQAKTLTDAQVKTALLHLEGSRYPERNRAMFLLSVKAGLRAKEIAALEWSMVTDSTYSLSRHANARLRYHVWYN